MKKFAMLISGVIPLPLRDIDTDQIIPAQCLTSIGSSGFGAALFKNLREQDPDFIFNRPDLGDRRILVSGPNFGCGSSREHAVWALKDWGIEVIIAPSFSDIFWSNSAKNGLLLIKLDGSSHNRIVELASSSTYKLAVDLESQKLSDSTGAVYPFEFDPFRKHCAIEGIDELDYLLSYRSEIDRYFAGKSAPGRTP